MSLEERHRTSTRHGQSRRKGSHLVSIPPYITLISALACVGGCGGEDGTSPDPLPTGALRIADFMPTTLGTWWEYESTLGSSLRMEVIDKLEGAGGTFIVVESDHTEFDEDFGGWIAYTDSTAGFAIRSNVLYSLCGGCGEDPGGGVYDWCDFAAADGNLEVGSDAWILSSCAWDETVDEVHLARIDNHRVDTPAGVFDSIRFDQLNYDRISTYLAEGVGIVQMIDIGSNDGHFTLVDYRIQAP